MTAPLSGCSRTQIEPGGQTHWPGQACRCRTRTASSAGRLDEELKARGLRPSSCRPWPRFPTLTWSGRSSRSGRCVSVISSRLGSSTRNRLVSERNQSLAGHGPPRGSGEVVCRSRLASLLRQALRVEGRVNQVNAEDSITGLAIVGNSQCPGPAFRKSARR